MQRQFSMRSNAMFRAPRTSIRNLKILISAAFLLSLMAGSASYANAFNEMITFGDSLSDSGNVYVATDGHIPASPYYNGRFTNGPNYVDLLAAATGLSSKPLISGGPNYAVAGATTSGFPGGLPYDFLSQVGIFNSEIALGIRDKPDKDALIIVFIGSNDMLEIIADALDDPQNQSAIIQNGINTIIGNIREGLNDLRDQDAFNILVPYLPNLARTPRYVQKESTSPGISYVAAIASQSFNQALGEMLDSFSDINIIRFETYDLLEQAIANAQVLGFSNVSSACYTGDDNFTGGGNVCADPNAYAFWDQIHPSAHSHSLLEQEMFLTINGWFGDVFSFYWAYENIQKIKNAGITEGCGKGFYCPEDSVTRAQIAAFIERAFNGGAYTPPPATGIFVDVPTTYWAADWIEQFYHDGITNGCSSNPLMHCPDQPLTRAEMAILLLRAKHGNDYSPPPATGIFIDTPTDYWAADWIEELYMEGITTGCSDNPLRFCPKESVTRDQMAAFLVRTFGL